MLYRPGVAGRLVGRAGAGQSQEGRQLPRRLQGLPQRLLRARVRAAHPGAQVQRGDAAGPARGVSQPRR